MKMSKAEWEAYKLGRQVGREEGYADGLHDGNPFITLTEAINKAMNSISDKLSDPKFIEYLQSLKEAELSEVEEEAAADEEKA